jgi:hypothetical protein
MVTTWVPYTILLVGRPELVNMATIWSPHGPFKVFRGPTWSLVLAFSCAGILEQSMKARNRVGIGLSYRPASWLAGTTTRLMLGFWPSYIVLKLQHWTLNGPFLVRMWSLYVCGPFLGCFVLTWSIHFLLSMDGFCSQIEAVFSQGTGMYTLY